jgi:hypothetical protein
MNWQTLASTLLGGLLTISGVLIAQALEYRSQKRAHEKLVHALLQGLHDEIVGLLDLAKTGAVHPIEAIPEGKPYEGHFTANQDYFTVYHANASLVMQIDDAPLRRLIIQTYTRAKGLLDTITMNRLYLERYHYLQSTFWKTKEASVQAEAEVYHRTLIDTAAQLRRMHSGFKGAASEMLSMISTRIEEPKTLRSIMTWR